MASTTGFPPLATTLGCVPDIFVNGYVYPSGPLAPGSTCVAPLVEVRNQLCEPVVVFYESRVEDCEEALANRQVIPPKARCLITGMLPSLPGRPSKFFLEDLQGRSTAYVLTHDPSGGYGVASLREFRGETSRARRHPWQGAGCGLRLSLRHDAYSLQLCGCHGGDWEPTVVVPLRVGRVRPALDGEKDA